MTSTVVRYLAYALDRVMMDTQVWQQYQHRRAIREWVRAGQPVPQAELTKHEVVIEYAERFRLHVFVETGTHFGIMVDAVKDVFDEIYSIELSLALYNYARRRFAGTEHVTILQGDSGEILDQVLARVNKPCLFYLDAHCSGWKISTRGKLETAICGELDHIFGHSMASRHVILIDDARCFTGAQDYPTIESLRIRSESAGFDSFEVKDDIIRIRNSRSQTYTS